NEYFTQESQDLSEFAWLTRIGAFKFDECVPVAKATLGGVVTNSSTGSPIAGSIVGASLYSRMSDDLGNYGDLVVVPGTYTLSVSAAGYRTLSVTITLNAGDTKIQNFSIEPVLIVRSVSAAISSDSCNINRAIEPGETATIDLTLRNSGSVDA